MSKRSVNRVSPKCEREKEASSDCGACGSGEDGKERFRHPDPARAVQKDKDANG